MTAPGLLPCAVGTMAVGRAPHAKVGCAPEPIEVCGRGYTCKVSKLRPEILQQPDGALLDVNLLSFRSPLIRRTFSEAHDGSEENFFCRLKFDCIPADSCWAGKSTNGRNDGNRQLNLGRGVGEGRSKNSRSSILKAPISRTSTSPREFFHCQN